MRKFSPATRLTAIFGDPVTHSLSPLLHNALYERESIDAVMLAFANKEIAPLIAAMRALPIHLAAVTMPHKQSIMPLLDEIDPVARDIGAVNTVVNHGGTLTGYNTDVVGVAAALSGAELSGKKVLLLGAGGAARTVAYHMKKVGAVLYCHNRDREQAEALVAELGGQFIESPETEPGYAAIVNATPIGMHPDPEGMPVSEKLIENSTVVFDLVYSPLETRLLRTARERGARGISGLVMFLAQGLEQERLWLGKQFGADGLMPLLESEMRER